MVELVIVLAAAVCGLMAVRTSRLLVSALWLAGCSALVALGLYSLGAAQVAVIELSVGAGLVTVLFVFAIGIAGEGEPALQPIVPRPLAGLIVLVSLALLAWFNLPMFGIRVPNPIPAPGTESFAAVLWQQRGLVVLVQVVLIFAGVLGALGLIGDTRDVQLPIPVLEHREPASLEAKVRVPREVQP
ncbi:MAG: Na(+)/H(+) antiporter subunit B [Rudaea sp.]